MTKDFSDYITSIGITTTALHERIADIYEFFNGIHPEEITDIFVDEYMKSDGAREYESITFFSKRFSMSASSFISADDFSVALIQKRIEYYSIKKENYDFKQATAESRFTIDAFLGGGTVVRLKASKDNCDYLKEIFLKYVIPNLKE